MSNDDIYLRKVNPKTGKSEYNGKIALGGKKKTPKASKTSKTSKTPPIKGFKEISPAINKVYDLVKGVQSHGIAYQNWVENTFFQGYKSGHTDKWDVPKEINVQGKSALPFRLQNMPVSVKLSKTGTSLNLGDAMRQLSTKEDFLLIVALWKQNNSSTKEIQQVGVSVITPAIWAKLWGDITMKDLQELEAIIKDTTKGYTETRAAAQKWKRDHSDMLKAAGITLNPKIDSEDQRRLQCSLSYKKFLSVAWFETQPPQNPLMCGVSVPKEMASASRKFNSKDDNNEDGLVGEVIDLLAEEGEIEEIEEPLYSEQSLFTDNDDALKVVAGRFKF